MQGISIVLCCYNSALRLPETLKYIAGLQGIDTIGVEVLIVDNASADDTALVAQQEWVKNNGLPGQLKVVYEQTAGLSFARKKGIHEAKFELILFCDDDNWLAYNYLTETIKIMDQYPNAAVVGGEGIPYFETGEKPAWFDANQGFYAVGKQSDYDGVIPKVRNYVFGASSVWRKTVLEEIISTPLLVTGRKKNKLSSSDDNEMCYKAILLGREVIYSSKLKFTHFIPASRLSLAYVNRIKEDSVPGSIRLHGLAYKIDNDSATFNSYLKRTWWGQSLIVTAYSLMGKGHSKKISWLLLKELFKLNWRYNRLFK